MDLSPSRGPAHPQEGFLCTQGYTLHNGVWLREDHTYEGYLLHYNRADKFLLLPEVIEQCLIHMCAAMLDDLLLCNDIQVWHTVTNAYCSIMNNHDAALYVLSS